MKGGDKKGISKEEFKQKELGLARKETNITHVKVNQNTLQPKGVPRQ
jgi:hypothetical protein